MIIQVNSFSQNKNQFCNTMYLYGKLAALVTNVSNILPMLVYNAADVNKIISNFLFSLSILTITYI